ncbi:hypothetical protein AAVH_24911, partial [Aphelenchoides avenae]
SVHNKQRAFFLNWVRTLYDKLLPFVLDEAVLRENGYPLWVPGKNGRLAAIEQGPVDVILRPVVPLG